MGMLFGMDIGRKESLDELKSFCEDQIEQIKIKHPESQTAILRVLQMRIVIAKIDEMYKENR